MKAERICIVYGSRKNIGQFLASESWGGGILDNAKDIGLVELRPGSSWFKEVWLGILKGFEE